MFALLETLLFVLPKLQHKKGAPLFLQKSSGGAPHRTSRLSPRIRATRALRTMGRSRARARARTALALRRTARALRRTMAAPALRRTTAPALRRTMPSRLDEVACIYSFIFYQSVDQSINQSINQPIHQPINQSNNQSINQ